MEEIKDSEEADLLSRCTSQQSIHSMVNPADTPVSTQTAIPESTDTEPSETEKSFAAILYDAVAKGSEESIQKLPDDVVEALQLRGGENSAGRSPASKKTHRRALSTSQIDSAALQHSTSPLHRPSSALCSRYGNFCDLSFGLSLIQSVVAIQVRCQICVNRFACQWRNA